MSLLRVHILVVLSSMVVASFAAAPVRAAKGGAIAWKADDFEGARAAARAAGKPLVVDLWAPWCHTCLSMNQTVLASPGITAFADRFVWVALDTDRPVNAPALERFPPEFWPTYFVIDPESLVVLSRQLGAANEAAFAAFLNDGAARMAGGGGPAAIAAAVGDRAAAAGRHDVAASAYARALDVAPRDWARGPTIRVAELAALKRLGATRRCLARARTGMAPAMVGHTPAAADFVYFFSACAKARKAQGEAVADDLMAAAKALDEVIADARAPLAIDDRSEALRIAREVHLLLDDVDAARERAEAQRHLLDTAAAAEPDPRVVMTWHWPRSEVHTFLGHPEKLVPDLKASAKALPDEYEPPYRLAWLTLKAGDPVGARPHARRATTLIYGPRAARAWKLLADIELAAGDRQAARAALARVVDVVQGLPNHLRRPGQLERVRADLVAFDTSGSP